MTGEQVGAWLIATVFAFFLSSIPTGYIVGKIFFQKDIRLYGSHNVGATNAFRIFGIKSGVFVAIFDHLKGIIPLALLLLLTPDSNWIYPTAAICSVLGHIFSPFLKFKGGKGVSTAAGALLMLSWLAYLVCFVLLLILLSFKIRIVSVWSLAGSFLSIFMLILLAILSGNDILPQFLIVPYEYLLFITAIVLVVVRHKDNIVRLINKEEKPISHEGIGGFD